MTAVALDVREAVLGRAGGVCEHCGDPFDSVFGLSVHHRHPRGMGGTSRGWVNRPANLLAVCGSGTTACHGWIESHRTDALDRGLLLRSGYHPDETPYRDRDGTWWLLNDDAGKHRITLPFTHPQPEGHH